VRVVDTVRPNTHLSVVKPAPTLLLTVDCVITKLMVSGGCPSQIPALALFVTVVFAM